MPSVRRQELVAAIAADSRRQAYSLEIKSATCGTSPGSFGQDNSDLRPAMTRHECGKPCVVVQAMPLTSTDFFPFFSSSLPVSGKASDERLSGAAA
jgi:hypothetical protein